MGESKFSKSVFTWRQSFYSFVRISDEISILDWLEKLEEIAKNCRFEVGSPVLDFGSFRIRNPIIVKFSNCRSTVAKNARTKGF